MKIKKNFVFIAIFLKYSMNNFLISQYYIINNIYVYFINTYILIHYQFNYNYQTLI